MPHHHPHALDLPEILSLITPHLTPLDLYSCIQVSHSFHSAFTCALYSSVTIQTPTPPKLCFRIPSASALTRYQHHIRGLRLTNVFPEHYLTAFEKNDSLQELYVDTTRYRRSDPSDHVRNLRRVMRTVVAGNVGSLKSLSVLVHIPEESGSEGVHNEVWEVVSRCKRVRTLEVGFLAVSASELGLFWEVCGGDTHALSSCLASTTNVPSTTTTTTTTTTAAVAESEDNGVTRTQTMTIPTSRSVKLMLCPMDEWPDSLYADESLILPAITSIEFSSYGLATKEPRMMSTYGQARLVRRCVNLKHLYWYAGDYRMDVARTHRWGIQDRNDADWFFGGLLGDTPEGPRKQWKIGDGDAENEKEDEGERWSLPCLESIETVWKEVPDATIARLLKRLHRLTNLRLTSPSFGPLAFQELVRERVPFRAKVPTTLNNDHRDSASPLPPPTLPPPTLLPRRLCNTVIALDISTCVLLSSDNILELLESCPIVETFRAGLVNMSQIAKRQDWACTRVKHLTLKILFDKPHQDVAGAGIGDDDIHRFVTPATANSSISTVEATAAAETTITKEQHRAVFAQLARLHHLKNFDFTSWNARPDKLELQLKLDYGLDLLSTWGSSIETLRFGFRFPQNIILEDAQWILDHWPRLKAAVCCKFHPDDEVNQQIRDVLTAGGVSLGRFQTF